MRKSRGPAAGAGVGGRGAAAAAARRARTVGESGRVRLPLRLEPQRVLVLDGDALNLLQQPDPIADGHRAAEPAALGHLDEVLLLEAHEVASGDPVRDELLRILVELSPPQPRRHLRFAAGLRALPRGREAAGARTSAGVHSSNLRIHSSFSLVSTSSS